MADESTLTARELLDAIITRASIVAENPELFRSKWRKTASDLDGLVDKLSRNKGLREQQAIKSERDEKVRELIILMRVQFAQSYLFDDLQLQHSQGCTLLKNYASLNRPSIWGGHNRDGITWDKDEKKDMPKRQREPFNFHGGHDKSGWQYYSSLDHAITNLICKVWGLSDPSFKPATSPNFNPLWRDGSAYLAVLLSFGVNILEDQIFLDSIGVHFDEPATPQDKLSRVLSASKPSDFWNRTKEIISPTKQPESE